MDPSIAAYFTGYVDPSTPAFIALIIDPSAPLHITGYITTYMVPSMPSILLAT